MSLVPSRTPRFDILLDLSSGSSCWRIRFILTESNKSLGDAGLSCRKVVRGQGRLMSRTRDESENSKLDQRSKIYKMGAAPRGENYHSENSKLDCGDAALQNRRSASRKFQTGLWRRSVTQFPKCAQRLKRKLPCSWILSLCVADRSSSSPSQTVLHLIKKPGQSMIAGR